MEVKAETWKEWKEKRRNRMVVRTIRNGRIKLWGQWFRPDPLHMEYDGRLDGMKYAFSQYSPPHTFLVAMWGTEGQFRDYDTESCGKTPDVVDNSFPWYFWFAEDSQQYKKRLKRE